MRMYTLAISISRHTGIRLEELAGLLTAIAGGVMVAPVGIGMLGGRKIAGLALAAAGVLWIIAIRWGNA